MTISEAISHAREVAETNKANANSIENNMYIPSSVDKGGLVENCVKCAEEHEQLAKWLEELKAIKDGAVFYSDRPIEDIVLEARADAVEKFAHELKETFNSEFPSNYSCTKPYFTLGNARLLVDMVAKEQKNE